MEFGIVSNKALKLMDTIMTQVLSRLVLHVHIPQQFDAGFLFQCFALIIELINVSKFKKKHFNTS